jgi:hypothetical protein
LDPRFAGSNPAEGDEFLRATKIRNTIFFGEKMNCVANSNVTVGRNWRKYNLICKNN